MARNKRWDGEFLVEVQNGMVLLPHLDPSKPEPTHYRITTNGYGWQPGEIRLVPMKVATVEDLRPAPVDITISADEAEKYSREELASLKFPCPFCGVAAEQGCVTRTDHPKPLILNFDGWNEYDRHPHNRPNLVHAKRLALVAEGVDA